MINELTTILIAAAPISELRGALPLALTVFKFGLLKSLLLVLIGNFLPVPFILLLLDPAEKLLRRVKIFDNFFNWLYARTRRKFNGDYEKWGEIALMIFVAIPLPATGAWSGAIAAHIFGIPKKKAAFFVFLGIVGAAIIVTALTFGISGILKII